MTSRVDVADHLLVLLKYYFRHFGVVTVAGFSIINKQERRFYNYGVCREIYFSKRLVVTEIKWSVAGKKMV